MKKLFLVTLSLALGSVFSTKAQSDLPVNKGLQEHSKNQEESKERVNEYKNDIESAARSNGKNNNWKIKSEELYNALPITNFAVPLISMDSLLIGTGQMQDISILDRYKINGETETTIGIGTLILGEKEFKSAIKTQKILLHEKDDAMERYVYSITSNWYSPEETPKLILSVVEKVITVGMNELSETKTFLNKQIKNDLINYNIIKAYPTPAKDEITLEIYLKNKSSNVELKITNTLGQDVQIKKLGTQEAGIKKHLVKLSEISPGNYSVQLLVNGAAYDSEKLVIIR
ncbi:MAG: T9SS type A sorting domain-containing protein [Bacteroidia bacterium]